MSIYKKERGIVFFADQTPFVVYLSHRSNIPFALPEVVLTETDFTYVYSGHLDYCVDGKHIRVSAGEALLIPVGHQRQRFDGTEMAVYTSIILSKHIHIPVDLPLIIQNAGTYDVKYCIDKITEMYVSRSIYSNEMLDCLVKFLMYSLAEIVKEKPKSVLGYVNAMKKYIHTNYAEKISLDDIAHSAHISKSYATAIFRKETGMSINGYVSDVRIRCAIKLLRYTDKSVSDIAVETGFPDIYYFSRYFKKQMKISPQSYRKKYLETGSENWFGHMEA